MAELASAPCRVDRVITLPGRARFALLGHTRSNPVTEIGNVLKRLPQLVDRSTVAGQPFEADHPLGAAMMVRGEAIAQVGLMDEAFHMYCEEIDWCWRIKRAGYKIYCAPQAEIVHYGGQSTAQVRPEMILALWRSRKRLYGRYYAPWKRRLRARR